MENTTETITKAERWRKYDRDYKIVKYHSDEEFRRKTCERALASYYRRKATPAVI